MKNIVLLLTITISWLLNTRSILALPPVEDTPEEILRTEIIFEGRSPITGQALNAAEYEEISDKIKESKFKPELDSQVQEIIFLLNLRKFFKTILPF